MQRLPLWQGAEGGTLVNDEARVHVSATTVLSSFREAFSQVNTKEEIARTDHLQKMANQRLVRHHDSTFQMNPWSISAHPFAEKTTLVHVSVASITESLDRASLSKKTLPRLLHRKLNCVLTKESTAPGSVVLVCDASNGSIIAAWMPGALRAEHAMAREEARKRHYVKSIQKSLVKSLNDPTCLTNTPNHELSPWCARWALTPEPGLAPNVISS